jgi:hypothetical protein
LTKSIRYATATEFDALREMAPIPLPTGVRIRGESNRTLISRTAAWIPGPNGCISQVRSSQVRDRESCPFAKTNFALDIARG